MARSRCCTKGRYGINGTFCDIECGTKSDRPQLQEAINLAKQTGATLLTAKLDRLSRSVAFIVTLMEDQSLDSTVSLAIR